MTPPTVPIADAAGPLRRLLLLVVLVGAAGLLLEMLLLEHWEPGWQLVPLALLALLLALGGAALLGATPGRLRALRVVLLLCLAAGLAGVWLHLDGNLEFEREMSPALAGWPLLWESIRGATPLLAPGALLQLGLVGLLYLHRHPALRRAAAVADRPPPSARPLP